MAPMADGLLAQFGRVGGQSEILEHEVGSESARVSRARGTLSITRDRGCRCPSSSIGRSRC